MNYLLLFFPLLLATSIFAQQETLLPPVMSPNGLLKVQFGLYANGEKAATFKIMVDAHEPVRPTGLHRTYPNFMACEAARSNEFNAFNRGNPPEHETILPLTRLLGGPWTTRPAFLTSNSPNTAAMAIRYTPPLPNNWRYT